jgi:hypothetical protein
MIYLASPFTIYSKNKIYRKIIETSSIQLKDTSLKIRDISQFREISLKMRYLFFLEGHLFKLRDISFV